MAGLSRRQKLISGGVVVSLPFMIMAGVALSPSKLERAGEAIERECPAQEIERGRIRFSADYGSIDCLLTIRAQLVELGFDRGDLEGLVEKHPWIAYRIMRAIVRFTHGLQRRMSMQSAELMHYLYKNQAKY